MNAILFLPTKVFLQVIDYYGAFNGTTQTSQIFHIVSLTREVVLKMDCMLTIETVCDKTLCVKAVKNFVGVLKTVIRTE